MTQVLLNEWGRGIPPSNLQQNHMVCGLNLHILGSTLVPLDQFFWNWALKSTRVIGVSAASRESQGKGSRSAEGEERKRRQERAQKEGWTRSLSFHFLSYKMGEISYS